MKRAVSNAKTWFGLNDLHQYQEHALIGILDSRHVLSHTQLAVGNPLFIN